MSINFCFCSLKYQKNTILNLKLNNQNVIIIISGSVDEYVQKFGAKIHSDESRSSPYVLIKEEPNKDDSQI